MAKPKKLVPWVICAPTPATPELTGDQRNSIAEAAGRVGIDLSAGDWKKIELARRDYVWTRSAKQRAIPYQSFAERLELILHGVDELLSGLCGGIDTQSENSTVYSLDTTTVLLIQELVGNEKSAHSPFELVPLLHSLRSSARSAAERTQHWGEQDAWRYDWHTFVNLLATIFEERSIKPTAAKSSRAKNPTLSPFVGFVWNVMQSLPIEYRERVQSKEAMADAIANSLAFRREKFAGEFKAES